MDAGEFDRLAKTMGRGSDRRALVIGLGASVLAVLFGTEEAAAKRKRHTAKARRHRQHGGHQKTDQRQVADENRHGNRKSRAQPVTASAETCWPAGHRCKGKQAARCCDGLTCQANDRGSARRCRACPEGTVFDNGACCTPDNSAACAGKDCGDVTNNCGQTVSCGDPCTPPPPPPGDCPDGTVTCGNDCFPACCPGTTESCYSGPDGTKNVGSCKAGMRQCQSNGTWGACAGEVTPSAERCDGHDYDCDGVVDTGCAICDPICPAGMTCEKGVCKAQICGSDGSGGSGFECDCGGCSGHGCCTQACTCLCDEGWTGFMCSDADAPIPTCSDYATCGECSQHLSEGCTWCDSTLDTGAVGVCTVATNCFIQATCTALG